MKSTELEAQCSPTPHTVMMLVWVPLSTQGMGGHDH